MSEENFDQVDLESQHLLLSIESQLTYLDQAGQDLNRMLDSYHVLSTWSQESSGPSMESSIKPMLALALAGTDIQVGDVSTESVGSAISAMGKAIVDLTKRIMNAIIDLLTNFDLVSTWMIRNVNLLERKRRASLGKLPKEKYVQVGASHRYLRVGRVFAEEPTRLRTELKNLLNAIRVINDELAPALVKGANALASRGGNKHGSELDRALVDAVEDVGMGRIASHLRMSGAERDRWGRANVQASPPLLGGKSLFYFQGDLGQKGVRGLRFHGLMFADTFRMPYKLESERQFMALTTSDLAGIPEALKDILMAISRSSSGTVLNSMKSLRDGMDRYVSQRMNQSDITEEDLRLIRSAVSAFAGWSKNVPGPLYGNALAVCRGVLSWGQASTKTYQ